MSNEIVRNSPARYPIWILIEHFPNGTYQVRGIYTEAEYANTAMKQCEKEVEALGLTRIFEIEQRTTNHTFSGLSHIESGRPMPPGFR